MSKMNNVLIVVADCLRADAVPASLLKKGAIYANAWACGSATIPAFASLYTGTLPHEHGHISRSCVPVGVYLNDRLPGHNYYFCTENPFAAWAGKLIQADGAGADDVVDNVPAEPWVIFYHSMITHFPYGGEGREFKDAYKGCEPSALADLRGLYGSGVDKFTKVFLELERTLSPDVSILTADHGDGFLEHGFFGHPAGRMFPPLLHVPLIVRDGQRKYTYKAPISMVNFPGLVVAQAEKGKRVRAIPGEECYSAGYRDMNARVASIRQGDALVISSAIRKPKYYQLAEDPLAQHAIRGNPVLPFEPVLHDVASPLLHIQNVQTEEDELLKKRLEALGYA